MYIYIYITHTPRFLRGNTPSAPPQEALARALWIYTYMVVCGVLFVVSSMAVFLTCVCACDQFLFLQGASREGGGSSCDRVWCCSCRVWCGIVTVVRLCVTCFFSHREPYVTGVVLPVVVCVVLVV